MSIGHSGNIIYLLLIIVEFLLKIIFVVSNTLLVILGLILRSLFNVNMTETAKKSKRANDASNNQTIANRGLISANWQKLLSSNLISDKKIEKPLQENSKDHFTGTFRRARKKKAKTQFLVRNELKTLDIAKESKVKASKIDDIGEVELTVPKKQDNNGKNKLTKFIAIDCEMVGIGYDGNDHMLARVSLVNKFGDCIYDKFVKPREEIIDYRTSVSGVRKEDLINGEDFATVQKEVAEMIRGKILVGHSLKHDLSVLFLSHPKRSIRDTSRYKPFRKITKGSTPSLKRLAKDILGIEIQHGEHSSVEDSRAAMQLYCTVAKDWERMNSEKRGHRKEA
ncbi:RNA exonuclease 4-like [Leguminivora glycinivorella]|uniref:RNA exonuclease 4-like n=1 Tax=Leguminivora glycinivorella TaxID=1035111 RepID=UPI00200F1FEA|nr:RNA exonuclease 4-like [Leguminivora glycinivorella]